MDLTTSLLNFNFAMIYIIYKILVLIKNRFSYVKHNIFEISFKKHNRLPLFKKIIFFSKNMMMENPRSEKEKKLKI